MQIKRRSILFWTWGITRNLQDWPDSSHTRLSSSTQLSSFCWPYVACYVPMIRVDAVFSSSITNTERESVRERERQWYRNVANGAKHTNLNIRFSQKNYFVSSHKDYTKTRSYYVWAKVSDSNSTDGVWNCFTFYAKAISAYSFKEQRCSSGILYLFVFRAYKIYK